MKHNPEVRRGFLEAQKRSKDGTWGLTDQQRQTAAKMGITDPKALAQLSVAMSAKSMAKASGAPPKASGAPELTLEQLKAAARLGLTDLDPKQIREVAAAMRSGMGFELQSKPAAA